VIRFRPAVRNNVCSLQDSLYGATGNRTSATVSLQQPATEAGLTPAPGDIPEDAILRVRNTRRVKLAVPI